MKKKRQKMNSTAKEYLDGLVKNGSKHIVIRWEGGNDDGNYTLEVDGEEIEHYDENRSSGAYNLVNEIAETIGYYSFAGDFYCNGEIVYDPKEKEFVGLDNYCETENMDHTLPKPYLLKIPKDLWFDSMSMLIDGDVGLPDVGINFSITNGPVVPEHAELETKLKEELEKYLRDTLDLPESARNVYLDEEYTYSDFYDDEEGNMVLRIENIPYTSEVANEKEIVIPIK